MRHRSVLILVPLCILLSSCLTWWKDDPVAPRPEASKPSVSIEAVKKPVEKAKTSVKNAADLLDKSVDGIKEANRDIEGGVKGIRRKDPGGKLEPEVGEIEKGLAKTIEHLRKLESAGDELTEAERQILQLSALLLKAQEDARSFEAQSTQRDKLLQNSAGDLEKLEKQISELKNENAEALRNKLYYLIIAGVLGLAIAAWMFIQGNVRAIAMGGAAVVLIIGALAVSFFMKGMGLVGFIVIAVVFVLIAWQAYCEYKRRKEEASKDRANKELVKTVEHIKDNIDDTVKVKLFGGHVDDGEVGLLQSEETKKLIREKRKALKEEFDPIT